MFVSMIAYKDKSVEIGEINGVASAKTSGAPWQMSSVGSLSQILEVSIYRAAGHIGDPYLCSS